MNSQDIIDVCGLLSVSVCTYEEFSVYVDQMTPEAFAMSESKVDKVPLLPCIIFDKNHLYVATRAKNPCRPYSFKQLIEAMSKVAQRKTDDEVFELPAEKE